jgi:hypothetical protein
MHTAAQVSIGGRTVPNEFAWNKEIFDSGLVTQPYGKGLDRFTAKFKPSQLCSATIAIEPGCHHDHGTAMFFEQGTRRCLITDTLFGLSDDEALYYTSLLEYTARDANWRCFSRLPSLSFL